MTDHPDLDAAGERAARTLAKGLDFVPRSILADPYAFAVRFMQWLVDDHWRRVEPVIGPMPADHRPGGPEAYERGGALARKLLAEKTTPKDDQ